MNDEETVADTDEVIEEVAEEETPKAEESEPEATETTEESDSEPEKEEPKPEKRDSKAERRIKKLSRKTREQEAKIAELMSKSEPSGTPPALSDFDDPDKYVDAVNDFRQKQEDQVKDQRAKKEAEADFNDAVSETMEDAAELIEDFDPEVFSEVQITQAMADVIAFSDIGPELVKHFYENPEEAKKIAKLSGRRQAVAMVRAEVKLSEPSKPKPKSKAPAPPPKTEGKGKAGKSGYFSGMTNAQFNKQRALDIKNRS